MMPFRHASPGKAQVYLLASVSFAFAALQNVTVDDAVLTGPVVPQYLPSNSAWNTGNNCSGCFVKPDPSFAYNGTWHDTTYSPLNSFTQAIEFTFTGTGLYIFFIIANNITAATTFTNVEFLLDQAVAGSYSHNPTSSTDYQYNVTVYANNSLSPGLHNVMIQPVDTGTNVLMLFDYLIYTVDTSVSSSASASPSTSTALPISTTLGTRISSAPDIGAIVGGTVGGIAAVVSLIISLLCYRKHKKGSNGRRSPEEGAVVDPFILSHEVATTLPTTTSTHPMPSVVSSVLEPPSRIKTWVPPQPSNPPASVGASSSSGVTSASNNITLLEQVGLLRDEVARLRHLHGSTHSVVTVPTEPPPEYS